eukprot:UN00768
MHVFIQYNTNITFTSPIVINTPEKVTIDNSTTTDEPTEIIQDITTDLDEVQPIIASQGYRATLQYTLTSANDTEIIPTSKPVSFIIKPFPLTIEQGSTNPLLQSYCIRYDCRSKSYSCNYLQH